MPFNVSEKKRILLCLTSDCLLAELGDFCAEDHKPGYISQIKLIPNQTQDFEQKVSELHRLHRGETPADAEFNYLEHAKSLDMYGIELHRAKVCPLYRKSIDCNEFGTQDTNQQEIQIGVSGTGLSVLQNGVKVNQFSWAKIVKISFKRRHFFVQLRREGVSLSSSKTFVVNSSI